MSTTTITTTNVCLLSDPLEESWASTIIGAIKRHPTFKRLDFQFAVEGKYIIVFPHEKLTQELINELRTFCMGFKWGKQSEQSKQGVQDEFLVEP